MKSLVNLLKNEIGDLSCVGKIGILDIGAMMLGDSPKEYDSLVAAGIASVVGFEPVQKECDLLNEKYSDSAYKFLPYFIGDGERQKFYLTNFSATSSLYEPNNQFLKLFNDLDELTTTVSVETVQTYKLDDIPEIDFPVDYIKIDVQGAELQVFSNAVQRILPNVTVIHSEVEWVPLYKHQPLFAEVEMFLRSQDFGVFKVFGAGTRPIKLPHSHNFSSSYFNQWLWSDVLFIRNLLSVDTLAQSQILKMALIMHEVYRCYDLVSFLLTKFDRIAGSRLNESYVKLISA